MGENEMTENNRQDVAMRGRPQIKVAQTRCEHERRPWVKVAGQNNVILERKGK